MKKLLCVFLALTLMLFALPFSVAAASGVTVKTENSVLQVGEKVYLNVTFNAGRYVQAFAFTVEYDPDVLSYVEATDGLAHNYESGKIGYTNVGNGTTDTVTFVFRTKAVGQTSVNITKIAAADLNEYNFSDVTYNFTVDKATRGDVNEDGFVNSSDLATLKLHLAGSLSSVSGFADYNMDSVVDTTDLANLKQYLAEG